MNIAIVVSEFNDNVTSRMLAIAKEKADQMKLKIAYTCTVPGAYDMPIIVDALLKKKNVQGIVTLGAIIKGQTKHDEVIAQTITNMLANLSIKYQKPVSLGISGPGMQQRHAYARIRPVAERAVESIVKISKELERIQK